MSIGVGGGAVMIMEDSTSVMYSYYCYFGDEHVEVGYVIDGSCWLYGNLYKSKTRKGKT